MAVRFTPGGLQSYDPLAQFKKKRPIGGGGGGGSSQAPVSPPSAEPTVYRDPKSGKVTGYKDPTSGKVYFGLDKKEVEAILARKRLGPETEALEQAGIQQKRLGEFEALQGQIGNVDQIQQLLQTNPALAAMAQRGDIDWGQAFTRGLIKNVAPTAIGAGVAGAGAGALVGAAGGPIGATGGAVIGFTAGAAKALYTGVVSNIETQKKGQIGAAQDVLKAAKSNMRKLATAASYDPVNSEKYIQQYNFQLAQVNAAYTKVKLETQGNQNKWIEDGTDILSDFELFLQDGGTADLYGNVLSSYLRISIMRGTYLTQEDMADLQIQLSQLEILDKLSEAE